MEIRNGFVLEDPINCFVGSGSDLSVVFFLNAIQNSCIVLLVLLARPNRFHGPSHRLVSACKYNNQYVVIIKIV